jgi:hypothetical protein
MRRLLVEVLVDARRLERAVRAEMPDVPAGAHEERLAFYAGVERLLRAGAFALQRVEECDEEAVL